MGLSATRILISTCVLIVSMSYASAQGRAYQSKETYDKNSLELKKEIEAEGRKYIDPLPKSNGHIADIIQSMVDWHLEMIDEEYFIQDEALEKYVTDLVDGLIEGTSASRPFKVLIARDFTINARCTGIGSMIVNIGLIARLQNEEQLAFVLGHELAHWELEHIRKKIILTLESDQREDAEKAVKRLTGEFGKISMEEIAKIRSWMYTTFGYSREMEFQADSMGFRFYARKYGDLNQPAMVMEQFDSAYLYSPYFGSSIFRALDFPSKPFNADWVKVDNRELILATKVREELQTHPNLDERGERLTRMKPGTKAPGYFANPAFYQKVRREATMESVNAALEQEYFMDYALYFALRQKALYPNNSYVNGMVAKILLRVADEKSLGQFWVPNQVAGYPKELDYVNNFLHNIKHFEAAELAFYYMNQKGNFDRANEDHYIILFKICGVLGKSDMQEVISKHYAAAFPNGQYLGEMF